jgi:outer membrane protein assembly factor BamA
MSRWFTVYKTAGGNKHVLEMGGRASLIEAYGQTDDPPFFMRFYAGGPDSIRGFERRTVTPRQSGYQIGGKKIATGSVEYSIPLYEEIIRASAFVDAGSVWDAGKTDPGARVTNDSGFRASFGIGLSIRTPFSPMPLRFYIARPLIKNDEDEIKAFDFSFATRF